MNYKLFLSTSVWGYDYLEIFLQFTLKSLATKGNLLNKKNFNKITYLIYSTEKDLLKIKNHKNFINLSKKINIIVKPLKFSNKETKYVTLLKYQNKSLEFAKKVEYDLYSFIYPDSVFGENHFNSIIKKINNGYKAVLCPGPLIIYEEFYKKFNDKNQLINNKTLSDLALNNLHPFYQKFKNFSSQNHIKIISDRKKSYNIYQSLELHVAILKLNLKNLKIKNSYDEDLLINSNINLNEITYINKCSEGMIISLEHKFSERNEPILNIPEHGNLFYSKLLNKKIHKINLKNYIRGIFVICNNFKKEDDYLKKFQRKNSIDITNILQKLKIRVIKKKEFELLLMHREKLSKSFLKRFEVKKNPNIETEILKQITKQFKNYQIILFTFAVLLFKSLPFFIKNRLQTNNLVRNGIIKAGGGQKKIYFIKALLRCTNKDLIKNLVVNNEK